MINQLTREEIVRYEARTPLSHSSLPPNKSSHSERSEESGESSRSPPDSHCSMTLRWNDTRGVSLCGVGASVFTPSHRLSHFLGSIAKRNQTTEIKDDIASGSRVFCGCFFPEFDSVSADSATINSPGYSENAASIAGSARPGTGLELCHVLSHRMEAGHVYA